MSAYCELCGARLPKTTLQHIKPDACLGVGTVKVTTYRRCTECGAERIESISTVLASDEQSWGDEE